jgi:hypothetical protein
MVVELLGPIFSMATDNFAEYQLVQVLVVR